MSGLNLAQLAAHGFAKLTGTQRTAGALAPIASTATGSVEMPYGLTYPNIRPSLDLDFANGQTVDPRITFTRASTATRTNSRGLIEVVPAGVSRIDFDPVTGACKGLLIEEQRANLLTYSEAFDNAAWSFATNVTVTANDTTAPDGTVTADRLTKSANAFAVRGQGVTGATGAYTGSVYVKNGDLGKITIDLFDGAPTSLVRGVYDFASNSFTVLIGSAAAFSATVCPNGWLRISATATIAVANPQLRIYPGNATEATAGYVYAWGAQLEAGAFPTSYIPTVASQVTRAADVASMTGANFSSWYRQDEGSFVVSGDLVGGAASTYPMLFSAVGTDQNIDGITASWASNSGVISGNVFSGGVDTVIKPSGVAKSAGATFAVSLAYAKDNAGVSVDGTTAQVDTTCTVPTNTRLLIGQPARYQPIANCHIRSLTYYPKRLTNAELVALSTQ